MDLWSLVPPQLGILSITFQLIEGAFALAEDFPSMESASMIIPKIMTPGKMGDLA